jgi:hypothetical protein
MTTATLESCLAVLSKKIKHDSPVTHALLGIPLHKQHFLPGNSFRDVRCSTVYNSSHISIVLHNIVYMI